jgi:ATP-binding cassette subfamily F protein uup
VAYFDQMREALDPEKTVAETISPGSDWIEVGGTRKHVMTYLAEFLFPPQRAGSPVKTLSGGERNRLLLARLFARPTNLLVLDEPTNDLDIESLEMLETTLQDYRGTLLLVSHDRTFLDNVVTQTLVAEGNGRWTEYPGGYSDWVALRPGAPSANAAPVAPPPKSERAPTRTVRVKLSFKEQRDLESLPGEIEALEQEQHALTERMSAPDYHRRGPDAIRADRARAEAIEHELAGKFERWSALEEKARQASQA